MAQAEIEVIGRKVMKGERISESDAVDLFQSEDLISIGKYANLLREKIHGNKTYYIVNRHVDYSNICAIKCKFCAFAKKRGEEGSFEYSIEEILGKVKDGQKRGITEVHLVGSLHPDNPWEYYTGLIKAIKKEAPDLHVKAFTAVEIRYFSKKFKKTEEEILKELMDAGLDSLPGGGAEIFSEKIRKEICGPKGSAELWLNTHRLAHKMGLRSNATMLYGHIESIEDRVDHMKRIRDLQDETGGFLSFIPLAFNPKGTAYESLGHTSGIDDLKTIAVSRLYLDNIKHIKTYWIMSGVESAQMALHFGADDLHGTVMEENITHMAGAETPKDLPEERLCQLIKSAGREPVQRDSLYRRI